jgi:RNA polymerase sigma-70 factor, ECF subfamily
VAPDPAAVSESSTALLDRARAGDREALERLVARYLARLTRWASGRAPAWVRDEGDTDDFVQDAVLGTLRNINGFVPRHDGALLGYLREAVLNRIRDRVRRGSHLAPPGPWVEQVPTPAPSPLDSAIGRETLDRYEAALARLRPDDRDLIVARVELGQGYEELAVSFGKPSVNATRVAVCRALARLAREMKA